ncbi:MAG TPA: phage tail tube protein, partial [Mycobacteriales bacterium]|nr:phage tail tube protein [Mycobacteriales bacterium]
TSGTCTKPPYTYAGAPNASSDDPKRITFEIGGVGSPAWPSEYQLAGCTGTKLEFDFQKQALWGIKATYAGMVVVDQSKTAALSARTVHHIRTIDTRAYLNGTGSAFGNTELASRVISGSLTYENGGDPRQVWSGSGAPSMVALVGPQKVSGKLRLHFSANTEKVSWIGATAQRLRIAATGSALGAGNYSATIDVGVELTKWTPVADKGLIAVDVEFKGMKDSSLGSQIKITTLNDIALQP